MVLMMVLQTATAEAIRQDGHTFVPAVHAVHIGIYLQQNRYVGQTHLVDMPNDEDHDLN